MSELSSAQLKKLQKSQEEEEKLEAKIRPSE
jgi:hypothetical protein